MALGFILVNFVLNITGMKLSGNNTIASFHVSSGLAIERRIGGVLRNKGRYSPLFKIVTRAVRQFKNV